MKKTAAATALFVLSLVLMTSCKKEEPAVLPEIPATTEHPLQQVFAANLAAATQHFTINTDNTTTYVHGNHGLFASFVAHAFRKPDGTTATGPIDITLVEAYKVGDMLWLNKQTLGNANGQVKLLVSGGQFRLTAAQGGEALHLAPGSSFMSVPITALPDAEMALFSGRTQDDGTMMWDPWPNNPIIPYSSFELDSLPPGSFTYSFYSDSLNWINCDYFYNSGAPLTALQVTCPTQFTVLNSMVWVVFPALNSLTGLGFVSGSLCSTGGGYELPVGLNVTVVALGQVGQQYYSSFTPAVVSQGMNLNITLVPTTLDQFQQDAGGL